MVSGALTGGKSGVAGAAARGGAGGDGGDAAAGIQLSIGDAIAGISTAEKNGLIMNTVTATACAAIDTGKTDRRRRARLAASPVRSTSRKNS
jgi:hypothetical protein